MRSPSTISSTARASITTGTRSISRATPRPASTRAPFSRAGSTEQQLFNFRRELRDGRGFGLSSYPHPWLMPSFWEFPTVSMGLGPIMAIYQARFNHYLEDRGLHPKSDHKVWAFLGDGETDEPEALGAISLAGREKLDNLIFVVNCNLQRLDGPVRGNGKIIQELEGHFRGAGWNVIKVIWGEDWDPLLAKDKDGLLVRRMGEVVDGESQKYSTSDGAYVRKHFFGKYPELEAMVANLSDEQLRRLRLGGHDPAKVYAAYRAAVAHKGSPTAILARTIKGYGLGETGEGRNVTHQQKKLDQEELLEFRTRFGIPLSDEQARAATFYRPPENSAEMIYIQEHRAALGGPVPTRGVRCEPLQMVPDSVFEEFAEGSDGRDISTTMAFVRILTKLLKDKQIGKLVVPIIPDEARTFGMESLFRQIGIYSHAGQLYEPVDANTLMNYREAKDGQLLEEGITEAGSMSSFIAAGCAHATHGINTIPFFVYYSMFGMQRIGDLVWAAADMRTRGFMIGGTAGRTTLNGEGLQHQDGNSHLLAYPVPNLRAYDPAFAFELAAIIKDGIRRMYVEQEDVFYYITVENEPYAMPVQPEGIGGGHPARDVPLPSVGERRRRAPRPPLWQRRDPQPGPARAGDPRRAIQRRRRRVEHHELQTALHGRYRLRSLQPAPSQRGDENAVGQSVSRFDRWRLRDRHRLRQGPSQFDLPVVPETPGGPRHRRLWSLGEPRRVAPVFRDRCRTHRGRHPRRPCRRRQDRSRSRDKRSRELRDRCRRSEPGDGLRRTGCR